MVFFWIHVRMHFCFSPCSLDMLKGNLLPFRCACLLIGWKIQILVDDGRRSNNIMLGLWNPPHSLCLCFLWTAGYDQEKNKTHHKFEPSCKNKKTSTFGWFELLSGSEKCFKIPVKQAIWLQKRMLCWQTTPTELVACKDNFYRIGNGSARRNTANYLLFPPKWRLNDLSRVVHTTQ